MTSAAEKRCLIVGCDAEATDRGYCAKHSHYYRVVLADPWFRNHPCPPEDAPQLPLHLPQETR